MGNTEQYPKREGKRDPRRGHRHSSDAAHLYGGLWAGDLAAAIHFRRTTSVYHQYPVYHALHRPGDQAHGPPYS